MLPIFVQTKTVVILLTNRVHPHDEGSIVSLRSKVTNVTASSVMKIERGVQMNRTHFPL